MMGITKISTFNAVNLQTSIGKSSSTSVLDFKSLLANEIVSKDNKFVELDPNFQYRRIGITDAGDYYNPNNEAEYPPKDAPEWFQREWTNMVNSFSEKAKHCKNFTSTLKYGDYFAMYQLDDNEHVSTAQARIDRLGYAGCLELFIKSQKHVMEHNSGAEYNEILTKLENLMQKVKESDDATVQSQINRADMEFSATSKKLYQDVMMYNELSQQPGFSEDDFKRLQMYFKQTMVKFMPDGTILTTIMRDGHIINSFRHKQHTLDLL